MGWWSHDILGGDWPLDVLGDIHDTLCSIAHLKEEYIPEDGAYYGYNFKPFEKILSSDDEINTLMSRCRYSFSNEEDHISYQVLGLAIMSTGYKMPEKFKKLVIEHSEKDEYIDLYPERKVVITNFIKAVRSYKPGNPVIVSQKGLFQSIKEHTQNGGTGLVNKNYYK